MRVDPAGHGWNLNEEGEALAVLCELQNSEVWGALRVNTTSGCKQEKPNNAKPGSRAST